MTIENTTTGKQLILSKAFDSRVKILNLFYCFSFLVTSTVFLKMIFTGHGSLLASTLGFLMVAALYTLCFRFMDKAVMSEKLLITPEALQIVQKGYFHKKVKKFDFHKVQGFRHLAKKEPTKHPLAGETFDYTGFAAVQALANEVHGHNRIAFEYEGKTILFGENIYSWDFDELKIIINDVTNFQYLYDVIISNETTDDLTDFDNTLASSRA